MATTVKSYTKVLLFVTHFVTLMMKSARLATKREKEAYYSNEENY